MARNASYDVGMRLRAAGLYDEGRGRASIAALLGIPEETVGKWLDVYRSAGIEVLTMMGKKHNTYSFETKLAAVKAVVDEGMTMPSSPCSACTSRLRVKTSTINIGQLSITLSMLAVTSA